MELILRPMTESDLDVFEAAASSSEGTGELQWFGHRPWHAIREDFARDGLLNQEGGRMTIEVEGRPAGWVRWSKAVWGPPHTSWCWHLAIVVQRRHRGKGVGTEAQRQLVAYLFAHTRAERIEAVTDVSNVAEQRALEKAGFEREGVLRRAQWRDGGWHDQMIYSVLRDSPVVHGE